MHTILTIVVAAGSGTRMGSDIPKQFLPLDGEPIVMRTLRRMAEGVEHYLTSRSDFSTPQTQPVNKIGQNAEQTVDNSVHKRRKAFFACGKPCAENPAKRCIKVF